MSTVHSAHMAYPRRDDQAELARVVWLNTKIVAYTRERSPISVLTRLDVE